MNVIIIDPDNRVCVDGVWKTVELDLPGIISVRFDGTTAITEPEPGPDAEPRTLTAEEFNMEFGHVLEAFAAAKTDKELVQRPVVEPSQPVDIPPPMPDPRIAQLEEQLRAVQITLDALRSQVTQ